MPSTWLAADSEASTVAGLLVEFRDWWGRSEPPADRFVAGVQRLMGDPDTEYLLGATGEGLPATGVCQLRYRFGLWHDAEDAWLEDLFVRADARQSGLGRELVLAATARARARGCARLELDVNEANRAAHSLYERLGFTAVSTPPGGRNLKMSLAI